MKQSIKLTSHDFIQRTHHHFAWMRRHAPVYRARLTRRRQVYLITRYGDVASLLKDPRLVKNPDNINSENKPELRREPPRWFKAFRPLLHNMLNSDEPDHRRMRNLVHKAFTPQMLTRMTTRIEVLSHQLLDQAQRQEKADLVRDYALPLPIQVIADMIGVPPKDRLQLRTQAEYLMVDFLSIKIVRAIPVVKEFLNYVRQLAQQRRADPRDDLLTALVQAEDDGDRFTEDELLGMVALLFIAGYETTMGLITNGAVALLSHPQQLALLKESPTLMTSAVEELLRYDGPVPTAEMSFARQPLTLHGVTIPQGAIVLLATLSANRDEAVFENADQLDLTRTPNKHLAFGQGIHYCLGAPLARLEGRIAFRTLLERCPNLRLAVPPQQLHYHQTLLSHRFKRVPVILS